MKNYVHLILIAFCIQSFGQSIEISSQVKQVTIYIQGALVQRQGKLDLEKGRTELNISGLSPYLDPKTIQFKAPPELTILSISHRYDFLDSLKQNTTSNPLRKELELVEQNLKLAQVNKSILLEEMEFLRENRQASNKNNEITLVHLKELNTFHSEQIKNLKLKELETDLSIKKLTLEKNRLEKQINEKSEQKAYPLSQLIILVETKSKIKGEFVLSYFVQNVSWFPSYIIKVNRVNEPVILSYKSNILQKSKEDWKDVDITLSSADPQLGGVAPTLKTYYLDYYTAPPRYNINNWIITGQVYDEAEKEPLIGATVVLQGTTIGTTTDANGMFSLPASSSSKFLEIQYVGYITQIVPISSNPIKIIMQSGPLLSEIVVTGYERANDVSNILQGSVRGISVGKNKEDKLPEPIPITTIHNPTTFEFKILTPYTLNSDYKPFSLEIQSLSLPASLHYFAVPKADQNAFLLADINDFEKYNLLDGEATIMLDNTFVGKTLIETSMVSDTLHISLGRDKNIIIKRELVKDNKVKRILGNKQIVDKTWKITIKNNRMEKVQLDLLDQIPVSRLSEIEVSVEEQSGGLYNPANGEMNWKLILEPGAVKIITLQYAVKYPKDRSLVIE